MASTALFPPQIEAHRKLVDKALERYCEFDSECPDQLGEAIRYCLLAPGKRIRPLLTLAAVEACGGNVADAIPAACAVEMIHNYSLIHDDLPAMDDDELRRGRPTCHIKFGEANAILAGDALIPMAFETIACGIQPADVALECSRLLAVASGPANLVGGQADDLACEFGARDREMLERIHRRKTGALLTVSIEMGAVVAKADESKRNSLVDYGKHLGLAFQIVDDLLDFRGSQTKMGKRTGKDADRGKLTYPSVLGETESENYLNEIVVRAIEAIEPFGETAKPLELLAKFVVSRSQ
jgi:geranylgeranyl diphosphate synthase type II